VVESVLTAAPRLAELAELLPFPSMPLGLEPKHFTRPKIVSLSTLRVRAHVVAPPPAMATAPVKLLTVTGRTAGTLVQLQELRLLEKMKTRPPWRRVVFRRRLWSLERQEQKLIF